MPAKTTSAVRSLDRPTLLMVGSGDPMDAALRIALDRRGLFVEAVATKDLRQAVHLTAPDLILLLGDAAADGGEAALRTLAEDSSTAAVPVVLLTPDEKLESRMHAFRHGAMAVVSRSASADGIARKVFDLSREMSTHFEEKTGEIGEATFDELVDLVKQELRSGILSVHAPGHKGGPLRVVLGSGRPVAEAVKEFVARMQPHVTAAEPMYYQFHTSAGGAVELLDADSPSDGDLEVLRSLRLLLVDDDPARADTLAQELRARGAIVFVTDTEGRGLERAVGLDPQVAIVEASGLEGPGFEVVRAIRKDLRLRWASILVAPWKEIWPEGTASPDMEQLAARIEPLLAPERDLADRAANEESFDVRLESMGPSRMCRVLVQSGQTLHLTIRNPRATVSLDLAENLIVGARATPADRDPLEGTAALSALLTFGSGRVHVERRANPKVANVMSPVEEALSAASNEPVELPPSQPPRRPPVRKPAVPPPTAAELDHLPIEDDDETPEDSSTRVRDLSKLAEASEVLLDEHDLETVRPPVPPVDPKSAVRSVQPPTKEGGAKTSGAREAGPVAAGERRRPPAKRKKTLVMGAPALPDGKLPKRPPPPGGALGPEETQKPTSKATEPKPARKRTMLGMQAPDAEALRTPEGGPLGTFEVEREADESVKPPAGVWSGQSEPDAGAAAAQAPPRGAFGETGAGELGAGAPAGGAGEAAGATAGTGGGP
ncbi:MAG TPA: hypothetical protein RMH99_17830, partial [Sandaracinaceae bacterium LLY-WYZ-13_1]|nr:hypothetical protein [Sandaracinaceae bacterium LLY-WYZ-13_1]